MKDTAAFKRYVRDEMERCRHFNGAQNETCAAGVNYHALADGSRPGIALRLPCLAPRVFARRRANTGEAVVACERRSCMSRDEAEAFVRQRDAQIADVLARLNRGERVPGVISCSREDVFPDEPEKPA